VAAILEREKLKDLVSQSGTPAYVYNLSQLKKRIGELRSIFDFPGSRLLFATMANDNPEILATIAGEGVGACVNSVPHLYLAMKAGFPASQTQFTSTGITQEDMRLLDALGIQVNFDSPAQIVQWCKFAQVKRVGARVNAASLLGVDPSQGDRIGMSIEDVGRAITEAAAHGGAVVGLHVYAGTNFQRADAMLPTLRAFFRLAETIPGLEYVNIGGGIGIDYSHTIDSFDLHLFGSEVTSMATNLCSRLGRAVDLFFEPGRGLVGTSGKFITRITDIKLLQGITYVAVDGSIAIFPRPFHNPDTPHHVRKLGSSDNGASSRPATIVGRTTFSKDILARCNLPADIEVGDFLEFHDAGAYCQSMSSRFLGQESPCFLMLED
jgi:diaminopimelate decarboxylase